MPWSLSTQTRAFISEKDKVARNEKRKILHGFSIYKNIANLEELKTSYFLLPTLKIKKIKYFFQLFFSVEDNGEEDNELDDFNEEEDYIKFLQKENMSPMIPKAKTNKLPLPIVTCEWTDKKSANSLSTYRPGLGTYMS